MWKFKELDETQQKLLKSGIIDIGGSVDADMALYVREALLRLRAEGNPPVSLHITSSGGSVSIGLDIYDTIRLYLGQKTGIVTGYARSMAVVILQACDKRQCARHAHMLIHNLICEEVSLDVLRNAQKLKKRINRAENDQRCIEEILAKRTGKSITCIRHTCRRNRDLNPQEALKLGLVDAVV